MKSMAFLNARDSRTWWRLGLVLILIALLIVPIATIVSASAAPTVTIVTVNVDTSVVVRLDNFPANTQFTVLMGVYGTSGQVVTEFGSGEGGTFGATFNIPANLQGVRTLFVRLNSSPAGYSAYNYFTNNTTMVIQPTATPEPYYPPTVPSFTVTEVIKDSQVTVKTFNFPPNVDFKVRMGAFGTLGIGGEVVSTFNSGEGGSFGATFAIPASLRGSYQIAIRMDAVVGGYYCYNSFVNDPAGHPPVVTPVIPVVPGYVGIPTFSIQSVVKDDTVTILTNNFPPNLEFKVRIAPFGTLGIGGTEVGTFNSGSGGSFSKTFSIPAALKGSERLAIRADSTSGGFYAYNWFVNSPVAPVTVTPGGTVTVVPTVAPGYSGYPTFSISAVKRDESVTVRAYNLPPGQTFTVRMGAYGTRAIGGTQVTSFDSGTGGTKDFTFTIPAGLKGSQRIAVRMDSNLGYYAFNWFWNNSTN